MKHFRLFIYQILLFSSIYSYGQQSDSLAIKLKDKQDVLYVFQESIYANPSNYLDYKKYNLTSFKASKQTRKNKTSIMQNGKDSESLLFNADAYHKLDDNSAVWGSASYQQGKRKDVQWNESADYNLIYPYVVADSVGGDIKYENYHIAGGYVQRLGRYNVGISGFYNAKMEYRNIDPRPKNLSTRLGGKLGVNRTWNDHIAIGVNTGIEKYTQKHNMSFYSLTGFPVIYEMNGMGNFNSLLKGTRRKAYYDGWNYSFDVQLYDIKNKSWFVTIGTNVFNFEKLLLDFDDLQASKAKAVQRYLSAGKLFTVGDVKLGLRLDGSTKKRIGTENLFINVSTTNFLKIGQEERYKYEDNSLKLSGLLKYEVDNNNYSVIPYIGFNQQIERYKKPYSKTDIQYTHIGTELQWLHTFKDRSLLSMYASWSMRKTNKESATFNYGDSNAINQMLLNNYDVQVAEYSLGRLRARYDFVLPKVINVFVEGEYSYQDFKKHLSNNSISVSVGITF